MSSAEYWCQQHDAMKQAYYVERAKSTNWSKCIDPVNTEVNNITALVDVIIQSGVSDQNQTLLKMIKSHALAISCDLASRHNAGFDSWGNKT